MQLFAQLIAVTGRVAKIRFDGFTLRVSRSATGQLCAWPPVTRMALAQPQPRLSTAIYTFLMNKQKYESLPPDLKKVIDDNSGRRLAPFAIKIWDTVELAGEKVMHSKSKNKFIQLSPEETAKFKKKVQLVFDFRKDAG